MPRISASNLSKSYGERELFSAVSFGVERQDIIGFIGANGTGKTTLFRILTGQEEADTGGLSRESGLTVGYMEQHVCADSSATAMEEVLQVFAPLIRQERELDDLGRRLLLDHSDRLIEQHALLTEQFQRDGGLTYRSRAKAALAGLGFSEEEAALPVSALSGGQKSKLALARLLLSSPDLLLLDEPTNHLDIRSVEWLEEYISGYTGAAIIISHDRFFLDRVCNRIFELEHGHLYTCDGNYTKYQEVKSLRTLSEARAYENTMKEIHRLEGIIEQQHRWNREKNIKTAESKQKQIDRLEASLKKPDAPEREIRFQFSPRRNCGNDVLSVRGLQKRFSGEPLYSGVEFEVKKGDRLFLIGPNGCGKTTLLRQIMTEGEAGVTFGAGVEFGYFEQAHTGLSPEKTVLDEVWDAYTSLPQTEIRSALAAFLFRGEEVFKQIGELSGGERARVALCKLMLSGSNLLFLDEPTNHLDLMSREALEQALSGYGGTIVMVSHDRYFINKLATKICAFEGGEVHLYKGDYQEYLRLRPGEAAAPQSEKKAVGRGGADYKKRKEDAAALRRLQSAIARCEAEISAAEQQAEEKRRLLETPEIASDYERAMALGEEIAVLDQQCESLLAEWERLSNTLAEKTES